MSAQRYDLSNVSVEQMQEELAWRSYLDSLRRAVAAGVYFSCPIPIEGTPGLLIVGGTPSVRVAEFLEATAAFLRKHIEPYEKAKAAAELEPPTPESAVEAIATEEEE